MDFQSFNKIPRLLAKSMIITEKLDGSNAQITIAEDSKTMYIGSRNQWLASYDGEVETWYSLTNKGKRLDNFGFGAWAIENYAELLKLGHGRHYGEWWGQGIQRNYGLQEKRFSLFNMHLWKATTLPSCCSVVPVLYNEPGFSTEVAFRILEELKRNGSYAAPGFMNPEGIIVYHGSGVLFKKTFDNDLGKFSEA